MTKYVAVINTPGYSPWSDDEPLLFDNPRDAWDYLAGERMRAEEDLDADEEEFSPTVDHLQSLGRGYLKAGDEPGTVYGPTPGYDGDHDLGVAYSVVIAEEDQ